ncbi:MAG: HAD family hydrolase [Nitrospira sp.]|nr:HAD family hydrolase [bacterium]MBL7048662.1 HAD family hydrolase [Nitrospira sp.]
MIKLIIFDLDGTLADTSIDITNAINYALEPFAVTPYSVQQTMAMVGSGISKLLESLLPPESSNPQAIKIVTDRFLKYYDHHLVDNTVAYPGVTATLAKLSDYKMAVVSNKREVYSKRVIAHLGLQGYFDLVYGSDSVTKKKPSPVPIQMLLKKYEIRPEQAVMVGDSEFDVEAGLAAGVNVIAVTYGFRPREMLMNATYVLDRFDAISEIINQL